MITKAEKKSGASSQRNVTTNKNQINKNLQRYYNSHFFVVLNHSFG